MALTDYILNNYEEVKKLRGVIEKRNYASRKMVSNIGYQEEKEDDTYIYVTKSR